MLYSPTASESKWAQFRDRFDEAATGANITIAAGAMIFLVIIGIAIQFFFGSGTLNKSAYQDVLVQSPDLPAPPFTEWDRELMDDPAPASRFAGGDVWDDEACRANSSAYKELDDTLVGGTGWSGASFYKAAYDSTMTVQIGNSGGGSTGGLSTLVNKCSSMYGEDDGGRKHYGSIQQMPINLAKYNISQGIEWVEEHTIYDGKEIVSESSTVVVIARRGHTTLQVTLTKPGVMEDNALKHLELMFFAQTTRLDTMHSSGQSDGE